MKEFKVKIELGLKKIKNGISIKRLPAIFNEISNFFINLGEDFEINPENNEWVALNFHNSDLHFELANNIDDAIYSDMRDTYNLIVYDTQKASKEEYIVSKINPRTIRQYTKIAEKIDAEEKVRFGLYEDDTAEQNIVWAELTKDIVPEINKAYILAQVEEVQHFGEI